MQYIKLMRPKHYIKNFLIFLPLVFNGNLLNFKYINTGLLGIICFSFLASSIYIINDIKDKEKDRIHNTKKRRPIASEKVSVKNAYILTFILLIFVILVCAIAKFNVFSIILLLLYFVLNLIYSFGAKNIPLVDIVILVSGFVIRVLFGASILNINVSNWLYLTTISASFYFGLGKRRNEIIKSGLKSRKVLEYYNQNFLDKNMYMCLTMTIVFYSLWATDNIVVVKNNNSLIWTVPLVIIILMRYSMNVENNSEGDPIEVITNDKILIGLILIHIISLFCILYIM